MAQAVMPPHMAAQRFTPPRMVEVPDGIGGIPLIGPEDPKHKQVQEVWTANVRVFDLSKEDDTAAYQQVWQRICDGLAKLSESKLDFVEKKGTYVALLRWADLSYKLPTG